MHYIYYLKVGGFISGCSQNVPSPLDAKSSPLYRLSGARQERATKRIIKTSPDMDGRTRRREKDNKNS